MILGFFSSIPKESERRAPKTFPSGTVVWLCVIVAIIGFTASLTLWRILRRTERGEADRRTELTALAVRADLLEDIQQRLKATESMAHVWGLQPPPSAAERHSVALVFIEEYQGYETVEFVDPSFQVKEVISLNNEQSDLGKNLSTDATMLDALWTSRKTHTTVVIAALLPDGKLRRQVIVPVQYRDEFRGFVLVKVDVQSALGDMVSNMSGLGYAIKIMEYGREVFATGTADATLTKEWGKQSELSLQGADFKILVVPGPELRSTFETQLPKIALFIGLSLTSLLMLLIYFAGLADKHSRDRESTKAELRSSIELQRKGQDALLESAGRFYGILEMSPDAIVITDEDQQIMLFNRGAEQVFGYSSTEIIGKRLDVLLPPRLHQVHRGHVAAYGEVDTSSRPMSPARPIVGLRKSGVEFPIEASISTLVLDGKRIYTAILRDVTERRQAEEALRKSHLELEARVLQRTSELELANSALLEEIEERSLAETMLSQLSGRLLQLQDEERRRIARELHDSTAQYLAALALHISVVKSGAVDLANDLHQNLSDALEVVDRCSNEIRTMSYLLHPPLLDELGLVPALEWYAAGFAKRSGVTVRLQLPPKNTRFPADIERTLFRIVQECLTNVRKHSKATEATITLVASDGEVRLEVRDNGVGIAGFSEETADLMATLGVGIAGMRERVRQLGGRLEISSSDVGTFVSTALVIAQQSFAAPESGRAGS